MTNEISTDTKYLKALLACALNQQEEGKSISLLNRAGFSNGEIAELVGMKPGAVQKRIERAKQANKSRRK